MAKGISRGASCPVFSEERPDISPEEGEVWKVNLPQACKAGSEIWGVRPCVVVSSNHSHPYGLRLVVPLTGFNPTHRSSILGTVVRASPHNGLDKDSTGFVFHSRSCDLRRFSGHSALGEVRREDLQSLRASFKVFLNG